MAEPVLQIQGLCKSFGSLVATDSLHLEILEGEIHAIIGPNGAGKTTLIAQLSGELRPDAGRVRFEGRDITALSTPARSALGLARAFQITSIFPDLTTLDNVALAVQAHAGHSFRFWRPARQDAELRQPALEILTEIGLSQRETFQDPRRIVIYGQRTADDRLAFGARGQYFYGSRVRDRFASGDPLLGEVQQVLESIFPVLRGHAVSHRWGGAMGVPRDWCPSVGIDSKRGLAWAGGYVGDGVAASNLAGRTLADLILGRESERVTLPWVGTPFPNWEPEPFRWLGVTATRWTGEVMDRAELQGRVAPRLGAALFRTFVRK